jgi:hypothetical protein
MMQRTSFEELLRRVVREELARYGVEKLPEMND